MSLTDATTKVSIILTTYNGSKYIVETIESVRSQTYQNWELIIIDDGSKDNTCKIITAIEDKRIRLYEAGRIGINGKVKNIGLAKASGDLVAFIDHDDLWAPTKIQKQVEVLCQYPEAGFSLTGGYNFKKPGEPFEYFYKERQGIKYDNFFISFFQSEVAGFTQALLFRKECIVIAGVFKETGSFSDADFIIDLAHHFKGVIIYEPLLYRRLHDVNYISQTGKKIIMKELRLFKPIKKSCLQKLSVITYSGFI